MIKANYTVYKVIATVILTFILVFTIHAVNGEGYNIENYTIDANIKDNGDLHVVEKLKYKFDEDMNGVYRQILYSYTTSNSKNDMRPNSTRYQANFIENIKVYNSDIGFSNMTLSTQKDESTLSNGMDNVCSLEYNKSQVTIKAYSPVKSDSYKYIKYEYDLKNPVISYNDATELYWNFVGTGWKCDIDNLEINVNWNKILDQDKIKVFAHSYSNIYEKYIFNTGIRIRAKYVYSGTAVDVRIVLPENIATNNIKKINEEYDYNELEKQEQKIVKDKEMYNRSISYFVVIFVLGILNLIYIIIVSVRNANKYKKSTGKLDYYTQIPNMLSLSKYSMINSNSLAFRDNKLLLATILDLVQKKYIKMDSRKKTKLTIYGIKYDYFMTLESDSNFNNLDEYEISVIKLLFNTKSKTDEQLEQLANKQIELNERFKQIGSNYYAYSKFYKDCQKLNKSYLSELYNKPSKGLKIRGMLGTILISILMLINIFFVSPLDVSSKISMTMVAFMFYTVYLVVCTIIVFTAYSLKEEYVPRYEELIGLKKYLKDYSLIKERYPIEIALWGKYLVFASLFGISDKVAKEFKEELIKQGYTEESIYMTYPILNIATYSSSINNSMASSGYSGGGGGRRRRWRSLLIKERTV
ncbi:MAG: DUF2207 domain-containing protein [Clostridia bacterium]|nr:DUF2207 domain-containing protein [Clostridia bacterium]